MNETNANEESYFLLGTGSWRDLLPRVPRPVLAIGSKTLYRVLMEGSDFVLTIDGGDRHLVGFFTTRFVAARCRREAEKQAMSSVLRDWLRQGLDTRAGGLPKLTIEESDALRSRFRIRSGGGFAFFGDEGDA